MNVRNQKGEKKHKTPAKSVLLASFIRPLEPQKSFEKQQNSHQIQELPLNSKHKTPLSIHSSFIHPWQGLVNLCFKLKPLILFTLHSTQNPFFSHSFQILINPNSFNLPPTVFSWKGDLVTKPMLILEKKS